LINLERLLLSQTYDATWTARELKHLSSLKNLQELSCIPDAIFLENGALAEIDREEPWFKKGDPVPPMLFFKGDCDGVSPSPEGIVSKYFNPMFGDQPHKEIRELRSDIAADGSFVFQANHWSVMPHVNGYARPLRIDLEEWFATLGFLPHRAVPSLEEANGVCRIEAEDFTDRSPRLLKNSIDTLSWLWS